MSSQQETSPQEHFASRPEAQGSTQQEEPARQPEARNTIEQGNSASIPNAQSSIQRLSSSRADLDEVCWFNMHLQFKTATLSDIDGRDCSICLEHFGRGEYDCKEPVIVTTDQCTCRTIAGRRCANAWFETSDKCLYCLKDLNLYDDDDDEDFDDQGFDEDEYEFEDED